MEKEGVESTHSQIPKDVSILKTSAEKTSARHVRSQSRDKRFYKNLALGLVHEIRNPLSTIHVNLQLLREYWQEPITTKEKQTLKKIDVLILETQRLERTLNTFFRFAADFTLEPVRCNLNQLVRELVDFLDTEAVARSIQLEVNLDPSLVDIYMDPNLIKQAVYNLILNAFQAIGRNGQVVLKTCLVPEREIQLEVLDNGPGISPDRMDKIFEVNFSTKKDSLGLGLPFVQQVVHRHQGRLSVISRLKDKTTFTIHLPLVSSVHAFSPPKEDGLRLHENKLS